MSVALVTATEITHAPTGSEALVKETLPEPAVAVTVPPHEFVTLGIAATTNPAGNVSVKLASVATVLGLLTPKLNVLVAPGAIGVGPKLLVICSGCRITIFAVTVC